MFVIARKAEKLCYLVNSLSWQKAVRGISTTIYWVIVTGAIFKISTIEVTQVSSVVQNTSCNMPLTSWLSSILTVRYLDNWGPSMTSALLPSRHCAQYGKSFVNWIFPVTLQMNIFFALLWQMGKLRLKKIGTLSPVTQLRDTEEGFPLCSADPGGQALLPSSADPIPASSVLDVGSTPVTPWVAPRPSVCFGLLGCPMSYMGYLLCPLPLMQAAIVGLLFLHEVRLHIKSFCTVYLQTP